MVAMRTLESGLRQLGHTANMHSNVELACQSDKIFLSNMMRAPEMADMARQVKRRGRSYDVISFFEYDPAWMVFANNFTTLALNDPDRLIKHPDSYKLLRLNMTWPDQGFLLPLCSVSPKTVRTSGRFESNNIKQVFPDWNTKECLWAPRSALSPEKADGSFSKLIGLSRGSYMLQVGRLEMRKNQAASILATEHLDIPLVFITSHGYGDDYLKSCVKLATRRKAKTIFVTDALKSLTMGNVEVIHSKRLSEECLSDAYANAGLHLHPAAHELPGLTYLEAGKFELPQVATRISPIKEYFEYGCTKPPADFISYVDPFDIVAIGSSVERLFGKKSSIHNNKIYNRTDADVAADFLA